MGTELPRRAAQGFADHLNGVLNRTISDSRLSLINVAGDSNAFELTRLVDGASAPLELHGIDGRLFVRQMIVVTEGHCRTESYAYRLQAGESIGSWLLRWEYLREPPRPDYVYPRAHVHVNALFPDGSSSARLHIPSRRVPLELVLWHLISDWGVQPKSSDWEALLEASVEGFDSRRTGD
jgi:hypothetical protein